jgi:hypothetical protein
MSDFQPVLDQDHAGVNDGLLDERDVLQEVLHLLRRGKAHDPFHAGPVVPAAVEEHDLAGGRQMGHVALEVHLRLLALGRRGEGHDAEDAWADPFGDALDDPALAGRVAPFEHYTDLGAAGLDPLLHLDQLDLELFHLLLELLGRGSPAVIFLLLTDS